MCFSARPQFITLPLLKSAGDLSAEWFEGGHREIFLLPGEIDLGTDDDAASAMKSKDVQLCHLMKYLQHQQKKNCYVDAGIAGLSLALLILKTIHRG